MTHSFPTRRSSDLSFPKAWIHGSSSCMDNKDPPVQVHWYNPHTAILRQNKAYSYEAPFAPLYFGNERSEEHTSELQSLMRISYAVFCLKKKTKNRNNHIITYDNMLCTNTEQ